MKSISDRFHNPFIGNKDAQQDEERKAEADQQGEYAMWMVHNKWRAWVLSQVCERLALNDVVVLWVWFSNAGAGVIQGAGPVSRLLITRLPFETFRRFRILIRHWFMLGEFKLVGPLPKE